MSFIIAAIHQDRDVYLATDSQMTNDITHVVTHHHSKITVINPAVAIAYAGHVDFCKLVVGELYHICAAEELLRITQPFASKYVADAVKTTMPIWDSKHPEHPASAVFLIAGLNRSHNPGVSILSISNRVIEFYTKGLTAGPYRFAVAGPADILPDDCIQICTQFLSQHGNLRTTPEAILGSLVEQISARSRLVDNNPQIWRATPHIPT